MKRKTILLALLVTVFCVSGLKAQEQQRSSPKSTRWDNWFISGGVSGNLLLGEEDGEKPIGDRLKLGGEFSVGKWFNPNFGIRGQFVGGGLRGFNYTADKGGYYTRPDRTIAPNPVGFPNLKYTDQVQTGFWQDFTYESLTLDVMANLTNLFRGYYKENAVVEVIPFAGVGYLHGIKSNTNPTFDGMVAKIGVRTAFNLSPKWAIFLEGQGNFTSDQFDGYVGTRGFESIVNLMAGVQFNINKGFTLASMLSSEEVDQLNKRINQQREMMENQQEILERQQELLNQLRNEKSAPVRETQPEVIVKDKEHLPDYVRFGLNSYKIEMTEQSKIEDAAAYLKSNSSAKLLLIGYADKKTGNSDYNYKLSCKRADAVATEFSRNGISRDRLVIKCVGDKEQPYDQNEWNRVVIMVER